MSKFRSLIAFLVLPTLVLSTMPPAWGSAYDGHPKLIIILVIDQFRGGGVCCGIIPSLPRILR